jgi:hypothetical protein
LASIKEVIRVFIIKENLGRRREKGMAKKIRKILKSIMILAVIFDIFLLLFEYRIIQFGAFCLGVKTSQIVHERIVQVGQK